MKICFVNLASGYSGGENQTLLLIKELKKRKKNILAVANPKSELTHKLNQIGVKTIPAKNLWDSHLNKELKDVSYFHAHDGRAVHWCSLHNLISGKPYGITRRIDNPIRNSFLTKLSYAKACILVGISNKICGVLSSYSQRKDIYLIPSSPVSYPVDTNRVSEIKKLHKNKFIVIQAASMLKHKGYDTSIEAAKILSKENQDVHFIFLGDGPEKEKFESSAKDLTNVTFMGKQKDMGNWFCLADALILPSKNEGLGSVLLEAMQAKVPVIASDVGGIPDIVKNKKTGLLIEPDNATELVSSILKLRNNPELANNLVENGYKLASSLSIEKAADKYLSIFDKFSPNL